MFIQKIPFSNSFQIEKTPYCNNNPSEATSNSVGPTDYPREIDSKVDLTCKDGYAPKPWGKVEAICVSDTPEHGKWRTDSICDGIEHIQSYLVQYLLDIKSENIFIFLESFSDSGYHFLESQGYLYKISH